MLKRSLKKSVAVILAVLTMLSVLAFAPLTADAAAYATAAKEKSYNFSGTTVYLSMPQISGVSSADVTKINTEIRNNCNPVFTEVDRAKSGGYSTHIYGMRYYTYTQKNVFSLVIEANYDSNYNSYLVYSIDKNSGKRLSNSEVCSALGTNLANARKAVTWKIKDEFGQVGDTVKKSSIWKNNRSKSISASNINSTVFCAGATGLSALYRIYWIAGSENYLYLTPVYNLSSPTVNAHATNNGAQVNWTKLTGVPKYRVYKKVNGSWQKIGDSTGSSMVDKSAKAGNNYVYTVRGISGDASAFMSSYNTSGKSLKFLQNPQITKAEIIKGGIKLTWNKLAGAGKYRVYFRSNGAGSWQNLGDVYENSASLYCYGSGGKFSYTIRALSADGKQFFSGYNTSGKTIKYVYDPEITGISNTSKGVKLTYSKPTGTEKFRVYRKTQGGSWGKIADTTATTYTDGTAKNGTRYYYTVRCISSTGKSFQSYYDTAGKTIVCKR